MLSSFLIIYILLWLAEMDLCEHSLLTDTTGVLASPNYPNNYLNDVNCTAVILFAVDVLINVEVIDLSLEPYHNSDVSGRCYDYLNVSK